MRIPKTESFIWLATVVFCLGGCGSQDTEHLARVGRKSAEKFGELTGGSHGKLANGLEALRANWDEVTLETRVTARLRWERDLEGAVIQVSANDGVVELKGTVMDLAQRQRAVRLARNTVGTVDVVDLLTEPAKLD
jgi:hypothetical protein